MTATLASAKNAYAPPAEALWTTRCPVGCSAIVTSPASEPATSAMAAVRLVDMGGGSGGCGPGDRTQHYAVPPPPLPMSNNSPARVRDPAETDPRIARTTHALGRALIELIQERDFRG